MEQVLTAGSAGAGAATGAGGGGGGDESAERRRHGVHSSAGGWQDGRVHSNAGGWLITRNSKANATSGLRTSELSNSSDHTYARDLSRSNHTTRLVRDGHSAAEHLDRNQKQLLGHEDRLPEPEARLVSQVDESEAVHDDGRVQREAALAHDQPIHQRRRHAQQRCGREQQGRNARLGTAALFRSIANMRANQTILSGDGVRRPNTNMRNTRIG
jgi:hypothetical protein